MNARRRLPAGIFALALVPVIVAAGAMGVLANSASQEDSIASAKDAIEAGYASQMANAPTDPGPKDPVRAGPIGPPEATAWPQGNFEGADAHSPQRNTSSRIDGNAISLTPISSSTPGRAAMTRAKE